METLHNYDSLSISKSQKKEKADELKPSKQRELANWIRVGNLLLAHYRALSSVLNLL
jgi:hypothetical protein